MDELIEGMVSYINTRVLPNSLKDASDYAGRVDLAVICIRILDWMRIQYKYGKFRTLDLELKYLIHQKMIYLIQNDSNFSRIFSISGYKVSFHPFFNLEQRKEILQYVFETWDKPSIR